MTERDPHHRIDLLELNHEPRIKMLEDDAKERKSTINRIVVAMIVGMLLGLLKIVGPYL